MKKILSKSTNRLISLLSLGLFGISLVSLAITGGILYSTYRENQKLEAELRAELENLEEIYSDVSEDGFYNVYSDGEYIVYGSGGSIIIEKH